MSGSEWKMTERLFVSAPILTHRNPNTDFPARPTVPSYFLSSIGTKWFSVGP